MEESKKIKKLAHINKATALSTKKASLKNIRASISSIPGPSIFIMPPAIFLSKLDLFFAVQNQEVFFDFSILNNFKFITSVAINKDLKEKILTLLLEPRTNIRSLDLNSFHNELANLSFGEWAQSAFTLKTKYEAFLNVYHEFLTKPSIQLQTIFSQHSKEISIKRIHYFSTYPCIEMRFRMKPEESMKVTDLCMNESFIREAGYTLENFPSTIFTEGIPQFFAKNSTTMQLSFKALWDQFLEGNYTVPEQETDFLLRSGYKKRIAYETHIWTDIIEEHVIMSFVIVMTKKSVPLTNFCKEEYSDEFLGTLKKKDQEKEYLLNNYYGEKFQGIYSNTDKVCKIRELN